MYGNKELLVSSTRVLVSNRFISSEGIMVQDFSFAKQHFGAEVLLVLHNKKKHIKINI